MGKIQFAEKIKARSKSLAVSVIQFCDDLEKTKAAQVIVNQLIRSATSIVANYRAACRGRSKAEFYSKICIVVGEADETLYWFKIIGQIRMCNNMEKPYHLKKKQKK